MKRLYIEIQGQVQGVGFRPHVYRVASKLELTGWIKNSAAGIKMEIQGHLASRFIQNLQIALPPLAKIDNLQQHEISAKPSETHFTIQKSEAGNVTTKISPDVTTCEACLTELFDSRSRYYHYPFINCTHCGPRYTITHKLPYDRNTTSMVEFTLCDPCRNAYENPLDRRYHAQPLACKQCGPTLSHNIIDIAHAITAGKIVALKGLGGYQLICDAKNNEAITQLRKKKGRLHKPFALMVLNSKNAKQYVYCNERAKSVLTNQQRPIVILPTKNRLAHSISPNLNSLGIMLPYTALHYLLFNALLGSPEGTAWLNENNDIALIVTSANPSASPLITDNKQAQEKLSSIADVIVDYDREIVTRVDDSVVRIVDNKPAFIRRARSYTPQAITLPHEIPTTLALGGHLKNTVCITRGNEAFISQHIGDLNNAETIRFYKETIAHLLKILAVKPECIAHDLHPDFYSTGLAAEFRMPTFPIQHHHAHLAATAAEHGVTRDAIGIALDGFGLGEDHSSWGGELIHYQGTQFARLGSLQPLRQPGGDMAAHQPWRMAASVLFELNKSQEIIKRFEKHTQAEAIIELLKKQINSPLTSSCGRLFDAVSSLLGICDISHYEGEAAMRLESVVTNPEVLNSGWSIENNQLNLTVLLNTLLECDPVRGANLFHGTLAEALAEWVAKNAKTQQLTHVLLSGGCFLNKVLSEEIIQQLKKRQLIPLYPLQVPVNDGGLSLGQAWIAGNIKSKEISGICP